MARPPNPETIEALRQRIARLERMIESDARTDGGVSPLRFEKLVEQLDAALGLGPGTLQRRINEALGADEEVCEQVRTEASG